MATIRTQIDMSYVAINHCLLHACTYKTCTIQRSVNNTIFTQKIAFTIFAKYFM